jgi:RNA polymerase sigma-70 factor (ECF subfamily)
VELAEHFFRREWGGLVAALSRVFGMHNLALAEDVVQDVLCRALEVWKFHGVPSNPRAWLLAAARNRALDEVRRERTRRVFAPDVGFLLKTEWTLEPALAELLGPEALRDDQLRMMFSCCHPRLSEEVQVALMLHILCGFGVGEVAAAFLSSKAAIEKRITRGKKVLAGSHHLFDLKDSDVSARLASVHRALYLLFNEGYHGASPERSVRGELCEEALRCMGMLLHHPATATPATSALAALMCFHLARLPGRVDAQGELTPLEEQDRSRWDVELIAQGQSLLASAIASPGEASSYHFEAAIAGAHASSPRSADTPWATIVALYDGLMRVQPSPVVALNRAVALAHAEGPERGLEAIAAIPRSDMLESYPFYPAAIGELELRRGRRDAAQERFRAALGLARNPMERHFLERRILRCTAAE